MTTSVDNTASAIAHTNIALIKYWGKANEKLTIPYTGSISLTLDKFYTKTKVTFDSQLHADKLFVNGTEQTNLKKAARVLNRVRQLADTNSFAKIESENFVPTSAGFASSASAFAALAGASAAAAGLELDKPALSRLARLGSGSASRSIFGDFVEWLPGDNDENSFAQPLENVTLTDIAVVAVKVNAHQKTISSSEGMKSSAQTSPYYAEWQNVVNRDIVNLKHALTTNNFSLFGQISEANAMRMHALTLSSLPPFTYFEPGTLEVINEVQDLRAQGIECYYTIDAGPNVKILTQTANIPLIKDQLSKQFSPTKISVAHPGPGIEVIKH
ncbi:diphosphomevalonate decarboxylase [Lentilactobacillus sp. SPB1-3]|uniref:Diphosphomevalonate decarboxylase n=1 Tax=Lentilactobacillus terminaliae TaxID=3003483 RepID=A0ACD5DC12_9LACO|nr:diphosphomevalonate decarboxylase [Lentilactobacillus sp. SPB1-3]MCZ0977227.1 diphosphomevalonate decarboxylase [Lentilactobacillus sp. SPB1-3]